MIIKSLKKEYETQDNRGTAYPIYVQVQELIFVGVFKDGFRPASPTGDEIIKLEHCCDNCHIRCYDKNDEEPEHCEYDLRCGYIWYPVEFFLTLKGADEYIYANKHNHGELRTYVCHFERRNFEMRTLLKKLGFKTNDWDRIVKAM